MLIWLLVFMKIFITGGAGFIGSHLADQLLKLGHKVAIFDAYLNFTEDRKYYKKCLNLREKIFRKPHKKYKADVRKFNDLDNAVKDFKPDIIIHLAGLPMARVPEKFAHHMIPINMQGSFNIFNVFEKSTAKKIVYTSSSMAYGHFQQTPQTEEFILNPINSYGASKAAGEYFVRLSKKEWVIIRPTSVYGFTDCANRVTQILLDAAHLNKSAWVVKNETLDFSYIDDVVDGFIKCTFSAKANFDTFNISRGEARAAAEFAEVLKNHFPNFEYEVREPSNQQVWRGPMSISKAQKILKFKPKYSIEEGIKKIIGLSKKHDFYD
jgi:UDP-glucose 4-epimerase